MAAAGYVTNQLLQQRCRVCHCRLAHPLVNVNTVRPAYDCMVLDYNQAKYGIGLCSARHWLYVFRVCAPHPTACLGNKEAQSQIAR